jgi:hypothetical protein
MQLLREQGVQNGHGSGEKPDSVKPFTAYLKAITRSMKMVLVAYCMYL